MPKVAQDSAYRANEAAGAMSSFSAARRLQNSAQFSSVFNARRSVRSEHFTLYYRPNDIGAARIGVATPKKLLCRAVERNTVRRIVKESFRGCCGSLRAVDMVLRLTRRFPGRLDRRLVRDEIDGLMHGLCS